MEIMESHGSEKPKSGWLIALALEILGSFFQPLVPFFYKQRQPVKYPDMAIEKADSFDDHVDADTSALQDNVTLESFPASENYTSVSHSLSYGEPRAGSLASRVPCPLAPSSVSNGSTIKRTTLATLFVVSPPAFIQYPVPLHKYPLPRHVFIAGDMFRVQSTIAEDPFLMRLMALFLAGDIEIEMSREIQDLRTQCDSLEKSFDTAYAEFSKALALVRDANAGGVLVIERNIRKVDRAASFSESSTGVRIECIQIPGPG